MLHCVTGLRAVPKPDPRGESLHFTRGARVIDGLSRGRVTGTRRLQFRKTKALSKSCPGKFAACAAL